MIAVCDSASTSELRNAIHTDGNWPPAVALERISSTMFGCPEEAIVGEMELPADERREQRRARRADSDPATSRSRGEGAAR